MEDEMRATFVSRVRPEKACMYRFWRFFLTVLWDCVHRCFVFGRLLLVRVFRSFSDLSFWRLFAQSRRRSRALRSDRGTLYFYLLVIFFVDC